MQEGNENTLDWREDKLQVHVCRRQWFAFQYYPETNKSKISPCFVYSEHSSVTSHSTQGQESDKVKAQCKLGPQQKKSL